MHPERKSRAFSSLLAFALAVSSVFVAVKAIPAIELPEVPTPPPAYVNESKMDDHTAFFKQLSSYEREWLLNTSMLMHLQTEKEAGAPELAKINLLETVGPTPPRLFAKMLDGIVSPKFHTSFINWLQVDLKFSNTEIEQMTRGGEVCGDFVCSSLPGLGSSCCPFG